MKKERKEEKRVTEVRRRKRRKNDQRSVEGPFLYTFLRNDIYEYRSREQRVVSIVDISILAIRIIAIKRTNKRATWMIIIQSPNEAKVETSALEARSWERGRHYIER